jgi:hypothetical protein
MQSIETHASLIADSFPGFTKGLSNLRKVREPKIILLLTVFNRVINEDSGLRLRIEIPVSSVEEVDGRINLFSKSVEDVLRSKEVVITQREYKRAFTVSYAKKLCYATLIALNAYCFFAGRRCLPWNGIRKK